MSSVISYFFLYNPCVFLFWGGSLIEVCLLSNLSKIFYYFIISMILTAGIFLDTMIHILNFKICFWIYWNDIIDQFFKILNIKPTIPIRLDVIYIARLHLLIFSLECLQLFHCFSINCSVLPKF